MLRAILAGRGLAALALLGLLVACGEPAATPEPIILRAAGSMTLGPLVEELAAGFRARSPEVDIIVDALGTQYGLEALRAGEAEIALASWLPVDGFPQGLDPAWQSTAIARDGLAIVVHPENPVGGLGLLQLADLFSGRIDRWSGIAGVESQAYVQPVSREEGSGTRAAFQALVVGEQEVTPVAVVAPSPQAVVEYVAAHVDAVGYMSMSEVTPQVKVLQVEGRLPSPAGAGQGSYALTYELWLVTPGPPSGAAQAFIDFVLGPAGQEIVGQRFGRIR